MRKIYLFPALCMAVFCLSACDRTASALPGESVMEETTQAPEEKSKVGICVYQYDDAFLTLYREELKSFLEEGSDALVTMADAGGDSQRQVLQVENYIEQGYDGLIVNLVKPEKAGEITDLCMNAGIPVVFINREPSEEEQLRWKKEKLKACYVGADAGQAGLYQGEIILDLPDKGDKNGDGVVTYGVIKGDGQTTDTYYRMHNPVQVMEEAGLKTSKIFEWPGNWKEEEAYEAACVAMENYGKKIEVMFCGNDAMAIGTAKAMEEAGLRPGKDIYLVGVDALEEAVAMVKSGTMTGTVLNDHTSQAKKAAEVMNSFLEGKSPSPWSADGKIGDKADGRYVVDYLKITGISDYPVTFK